MTLVIARATPEIAFMVGDSLLLEPLSIKGNPLGPVQGAFHALKIQIIDPNVAIAFATSNSVDVALEIIADLAFEVRLNPSIDIFTRLFELYRARIQSAEELKPNCEFLALTIGRMGNRLGYISSEGVNFRERAYIGDASEYRLMQELRLPIQFPTTQWVQQSDGTFKSEALHQNEGQIEFIEISMAMERLVQTPRRNPTAGGIGGNIVRVVNAKISGELEYLQVGLVGVSPEEGPHGYSLLASNKKKRGIGVYYKVGKVGFILIAGDREYCRKESADSIGEFIDLAAKKYDMDLTGVT